MVWHSVSRPHLAAPFAVDTLHQTDDLDAPNRNVTAETKRYGWSRFAVGLQEPFGAMELQWKKRRAYVHLPAQIAETDARARAAAYLDVLAATVRPRLWAKGSSPSRP